MLKINFGLQYSLLSRLRGRHSEQTTTLRQVNPEQWFSGPYVKLNKAAKIKTVLYCTILTNQ